jgi:Family of unknown function (DUF6941)
MKIDLALLCDYAVVDRFGKLSVLGIFEHLWITSFPAVHPRVHLVIRLKGKRTEIGRHNVRISLLDYEGQEVINGTGVFDFAEPPAGITEIEAGTVLVFDIPFSRPGRYRFEIVVDDDVRATVPLTVTQATTSPPSETPEPRG